MTFFRSAVYCVALCWPAVVATGPVGFGTGTMYLARSDDDDLEYLQRYRR